MARALIASRLVIAAALAERAALRSRGYAAAAAVEAGVKVSAAEDKAVAVAAVIGRKAETVAAEVAWVPDPVTGYYRPGNWVAAADAAEMREVLLNQRAHE